MTTALPIISREDTAPSYCMPGGAFIGRASPIFKDWGKASYEHQATVDHLYIQECIYDQYPPMPSYTQVIINPHNTPNIDHQC